MMQRKEHLTKEGIQAIVSMRGSLNLGVTDDLKEAFPNTLAVKRPEVVEQNIPHPEWLAGFTSGEGYFYIRTRKALTKLGFTVEAGFKLSQHSASQR